MQRKSLYNVLGGTQRPCPVLHSLHEVIALMVKIKTKSFFSNYTERRKCRRSRDINFLNYSSPDPGPTNS